MWSFKKNIYCTSDETTTPPPDFGFTLSQTCDGSDITLVADNVTGGTGPYVFSTVAFTDPTDAIDNQVWTLPRTSKNYYIGNVPGTYWVSIKDSLGLIILQEINADCWDSLDPANRQNGFVSDSGTLNSTTACGYPIPSDAIYVATRTPSMLANGDRVFEQGTGTTFFDGSTGAPSFTPKYWKLSLQTELNPCSGSGTRVLIDKNGFVSDLYCCPSTGE